MSRALSPQVALRELRFAELRIPFTVAFKHASAERRETSTVWIEAVSRDGATGHGESCPRPYVTGETIDSAHAFLAAHESDLKRGIVDLPSLHSWMARHAADIDAHPAAWCAIELAILDLLATHAGEPIETFLGLPVPRGAFRYSAVLGDAEPDAFAAMARRYRDQGFRDFKIKLSGDFDRDRAKVDMLRALDNGAITSRADANNLWPSSDDAIRFLRRLDYPFIAIEEPIAPNQYADVARVADALGCRIVLDESCSRVDQIALLAKSRTSWLINVRVSKMGGLLRSVAVVDAARTAGIDVIVGAQVGETSVLTRAGLTVAAAAGNRLVAQEGAFGTHLLAHDVCDPPLMFGGGGILDADTCAILAKPGLGITAQF